MGGGALVGWGSFMRTRHLCVLVRVWAWGGVGAVGPVWALQLYVFTDRSKAVLLLWVICVVSVECLLYFCARLFIVASWSPAGKGLTSWLSFVMSVMCCEFNKFNKTGARMLDSSIIWHKDYFEIPFLE